MLDEVYGELQPTKQEGTTCGYVIQFMDNFDGYTAQLSHVNYMNLHLCTLAWEICLALGACGAVTGSGELMGTKHLCQPI